MQLPDDLLTHFIEGDDFCRPEWRVLAEKAKAGWPAEQQADFWRELTLTWLDRIQKKLGPQYNIYETPHFFLVANPAGKPIRDYTMFLEKIRGLLHRSLQAAAWTGGSGKHVVLMFDEKDEYFRYIAPIYADGEHPASGGVFIQHGGYRHIAVPFSKDSILRTLAHEFTHNCVSHLPLPRWLDEALAMRFEGMLASTPTRFMIDLEMCEKHYAHWNSTTIQEFWSGRSWSMAGESFSLSYELSRILLGKIESDVRPPPERLAAFVQQANWRDAGEEAARRNFGVGLGELVADFLGAGDWDPRPDLGQTLATTPSPEPAK